MSRRSLTSGVIAALLGAISVPVVAQQPEAAPDPSALVAKAATIADQVAKVRGLALKKKLTSDVMSKDQIRERLVQRLDEEYKPEEIGGEESALKRLGLLPRGTDYKQLVLDLLTEQIAGFYDPASDELYIAGWTMEEATALEGMSTDVLMAHEIDHALQDQHFDLAKFMRGDKGNGDASMARQAIVEGDATVLMIEMSLAQMGLDDPAALWSNDMMVGQVSAQIDSGMATTMAGPTFAGAPLVMRDGLLFPYIAGFRFVVALRRTQPWSAVDAVYKKPPLSTEHILDPAKYAAYEKPIAVTIKTPAALAKHRVVYQNVTGQAGFSVLLRQHGVAKARADGAAMGWGGDRLAVYAPEGSTTLARVVAISRSAWDEEADAIEAFEALSDALRAMVRGERTRAEANLVEQTNLLGRRTILERRGAEVLLLVNAPADTAEAIFADAWK